MVLDEQEEDARTNNPHIGFRYRIYLSVPESFPTNVRGKSHEVGLLVHGCPVRDVPIGIYHELCPALVPPKETEDSETYRFSLFDRRPVPRQACSRDIPLLPICF